MKVLPALYLTATLLGCAADPPAGDALGSLALSLSSEAGGVAYRLSDARFTLEGPVRRDFGAGEEPSLVLELPAGAYTLTLLDGFTLTRVDDAAGLEVEARLVSANPAPLLVSPGQTTQLSLRFELGATASSSTPGRLAIDLVVGTDDAGAQETCVSGLRIDELDYEQGGADEAEFVEVVNGADCDAALAGVALELVNGGDGKVYARYELAQAAANLASGARLVLGDPGVIGATPTATATLALNGNGLQNGPDGVRLVQGEQVLDAVAYEGSIMGVGTGATAADDAEQALSRCPDAFDSGDAALDFRLALPSPGSPNICG
jgi:hypothetical protein